MILGVFLLAGQAVAQEKAFDPSVLSVGGKKAYERLLTINFFAIGGIGYGGATSEGEASLRALVGEKEAVGALKRIADEGIPAAGLYALLGLKTVKCDCLDTEVRGFRARPAEEITAPNGKVIPSDHVSTMTGCFSMIEGKEEVLKRILNGFYDGWE